jgi:hypothetical protein
MALKIENAEHFEKVKAFAEENGIGDKLREVLDYLDGYANRDAREKGEQDATICKLFPDFAPQSFSFVMEKAGRFWFNGGAIFYGMSDPRWGVHT